MNYRALFLFLLMVTGCTTLKPQYHPQVITQSMVQAEPEPAPPTGTLTQRDIAAYIIELRQWGRTLQARLVTITEVLKETK